LTDCTACVAGYYCFEMGITTVNNYLCKEGYYCPDGVSEVKCPAGTY